MMARLRVLIVAAALALAGAACSSDAGTGGAATGPDDSPTTSTTLDYAVGQRSIELVDHSRPTAADPTRNLPERPNRTIPVTLLYPAEGAPVTNPTPVVNAAIAEGRFPLVVFSHGLTMSGDSIAYLSRLKFWAGAGYVVAAPTFPLSSGPGGAAGDFVNQPDDVSFVIDELLARAGQPDDPLHQHLDPEHIGVSGHSLGAFTTIGVTFNSCCRDTRIDAAVEISGVEVAFPGGDYSDRPDTPLLAIHGAQDTTIPVTGSDQLIAKAEPPTYYVRFPRGDHTSILSAPEGVLVDEAVIAFFDLYLKADPRQLDELRSQVHESGLATLDARTN
jgi:predicted dienelactone hydrolase